MSEMTTYNSSDNADQLLKLAEEYGIQINEGSSYETAGSAQYTNFVQPNKPRVVIDLHKGDTLRWSMPGEDKTFEEKLYYKTSDGQLAEWSDIKELLGIVVDYSQKDVLGFYDGEKYVNFCSVIGHGYPDNAVKDLPKIPYGNKYQWDKRYENGQEKRFINYEKPNPMVEKLGLIGYRNNKPTLCHECISANMSTEDIINDKNEAKKIACEVKGRLHFAVFEFVKIQKRVVKGGEPQEIKTAKSVTELYTLDDDGEGVPLTGPIILQFGMSKSSIQGRYNKEPELAIVGFESYVKNLEYAYKGPSARKNPIFNYTSMRLKLNPSAPTYQTHFESLRGPDNVEIKQAMDLWRSSIPVHTVSSLTLDNFVKPQPQISHAVEVLDEDEVVFTDSDNLPF